jgi:putative DNA primase/helicase
MPEKAKEPRRPTFACYQVRTRYGWPGLYHHGQRQKGNNPPEPYDLWICSPIECVAATHDERGDNHGLLLRFKPPYGKWRQWSMPLRLLKGYGEEMRGELLDMGVRINPDGFRLLHRWASQCRPNEVVIAATRVGWHQLEDGRAFVMPHRTIAQGVLAHRITFQSEYASHDEYATAGSLESWNQHIGRLCIGNPLMVLAVSTALVGPLLHLTHQQTAGIHLVGDSSKGKTTLLEVGASVWGDTNFKRTWRATGNGLEGIAAALSDTLLVLDEIGEADGREIGSIIYALGNGIGKSRASRHGSARQPHRWRVPVLSSGERTLAAHMHEAGKRPFAGQSVRLLDIQAKGRHGVFDHLHHLADGRAFADHLKGEVTRHHGHLGPGFIERLVSEERDLAAEVDSFAQEEGFASSRPLQGRAAKALALIGLAGELATEYGLVGWEKGEAKTAAIEAFKAWTSDQGGVKSEHEQILANVAGFIERHGDARFSELHGGANHTVHNRAGWWRDDAEGRAYLFNKEGLKEALGGFELKRGTEALEVAGWIIEREGNARSVRVRIIGTRHRVYVIRLAEGEESEEGEQEE